ncbi:MAG: DUF3795 domain-containing protein [Firmicutes bacterium]|nr:DUF3795 domain-containing protein [Bacillota bacterium]
MKYEDVLKHLAPCGLDCNRCAEFEHGNIKQLSSDLLQGLSNNYERLAEIKSKRNPIFNNYAYFKEILISFSNASCSGCRGDNVQCLISCTVKNCHKEQGVDFCFQCNRYPCDNQFTGRLRDRWINMNNRMKEVGVVEYYHEQKQVPRY